MIYQSTPDYYNDFIAHKDHKYINKYRNASGRWVYVYEQPKLSDLPNPYLAISDVVNRSRSGMSSLASRGKAGLKKGVAKGAGQAVRVNNQFNSYMNKKASAVGKKVSGEASRAYGSAKSRGSATINRTTSAARKNASSVYNTAASKASKVYGQAAGKVNEAANAYNKYAKKRKQVAAGKKLIKQHNINKRVQKKVESDNAVYRRALSNAYKTIKRRKSK